MPNDTPRLMFVFAQRLSSESAKKVSENYRQWLADPTQALVVDSGISVYQLVAGQWQPIGPAPAFDPGTPPARYVITEP